MTRPVSTHMTVLDALPPRQAAIVERLGRTFAEAGQELVLVGGIVRDALMGRELPGDLDLATSAVPERTQELGEVAGASSVYLVGARFGTVGLVFEGEGEEPITAEITTYRSEHYPDETRHPEVAFGERLEDDLSRRDFTVNAIAADAVTGAVIDPFDGQADLARGILRAVGDPDARFQEDPLRLLRAARFVAQLGFLVEPATAAAMSRQAPSLARISKERIYGELTRLLTGEWASHGLETLRETGLITVAMPELAPLAEEAESRRSGRGMAHREKDLWEHTKRVVDRAPARPIVRWAALLHDAAKPQTRSVDASGEVHFFGHEREGAALAKRLLGRLKADRTTQVAVTRLVELHLRPATYEPDWTDSAVRRLMLEADGVLEDLLDLVAADVTSAREHKQRAAARRIDKLRAHIRRLDEERALAEFKSPLDGEDLMRLFARPPGRWIAGIKDHLRELVLDGELAPDDKATAGELARGMIERGEV
ncbi:MAG: poly(A) polymerase [Thermomicrobiales bacterium]|nr:poly(A) polymerase [Thermomicrobiales bacterium]